MENIKQSMAISQKTLATVTIDDLIKLISQFLEG
jgi:hypothetical protein